MEEFRTKLKGKMKKMTPTDIIAIAIIVAGTVLKSLHIDGIVDASLIAIVAFYFGTKMKMENTK